MIHSRCFYACLTTYVCNFQVPLFIVAQLLGSTLASCTLTLVFDVTTKNYFGTLPVGSNGQSFALEIIISFLLMFVISAVATDNRAVTISTRR